MVNKSTLQTDTPLTTVQVFDEIGALAATSARDITICAKEAVAKRGKFTIAISGGSLPQTVFPALFKQSITTWGKWHVFWADERMVPHTHAESNFLLAYEVLFARAPIPPHQIYPVDTSLPATEAAQKYQNTIETVLGNPPKFDVILLGIGPDGHTASLFPGHPLLGENEAAVAPIFDSPKPPPERVTLTLPQLNRVRCVFFIVTGEKKATILPQIFTPEDEPLPAARVHPPDAPVRWYLDSAAAQNITD